jgi:ElaA protein
VKIMAVPFSALPPLTAYSLWKLRQDVFVIEQDCPYPDLDSRDLEPETRHVVMENDDGVVLGCARVLDDGQTWRIGRVALHRTVRGQGFADALMHTALAVCKERDVVLDAQTPLATWYGTHGFEVDGQEFLEDGISHVPMRRASVVSPGTR